MRLVRVILLCIALTGAPARAQEAPNDGKPHVVIPPDWLKKPTGDDLNAVWPRAALARGQGGSAKVKCTVTTLGLTSDCHVVEETPVGVGFGAAAMMLTPSLLFKPARVDGRPVEARVTIPINFVTQGQSQANIYTQTFTMLAWAPWAAAPTQADLDAAYPKRETQGEAGHVVLRCGFRGDGRLTDCELATEEPAGRGFAAAALKLSKSFRLDLAAAGKLKLAETRVNLPIHFLPPNHDAASNRYISEPDWTARFGDADRFSVFPEQAIKAGVSRGWARVDCSVAPTGRLSDCQVEQEEPPALGFGSSVVLTAQAMSINLWNRDGLPTAGARMRFPMTLVDGAQQAATTPASPPVAKSASATP